MVANVDVTLAELWLPPGDDCLLPENIFSKTVYMYALVFAFVSFACYTDSHVTLTLTLTLTLAY